MSSFRQAHRVLSFYIRQLYRTYPLHRQHGQQIFEVDQLHRNRQHLPQLNPEPYGGVCDASFTSLQPPSSSWRFTGRELMLFWQPPLSFSGPQQQVSLPSFELISSFQLLSKP
jgi:hypothetical protein